MTEIQKPSTPQAPRRVAGRSSEFLLGEYQALRAEILKRSEFQHQLATLALVATGTFLSVASRTASMAYPILAMFLAAQWGQHDLRIRQIGLYVMNRVERPFLGDARGWEGVQRGSARVLPGIRSVSRFSARGVFVGSQLLVLGVSLPGQALRTEHVVLLALDVPAVILALLGLRRHPLVQEDDAGGRAVQGAD
jgi:hypothetical protein